MARWVKAKELLRMFKRTTTPTASDAPAIGDLWVDTSVTPPVLKICEDDVPVVFSTVGDGIGAPVGATYITQTAHADLTAEQALSSLSTGFMKVTTGTGVVSSQTSISL